MIGPNSTIWAYFCTKCEGVSFLPSNGKNWTGNFKNRKLTSIWLKSIQHYRRWRNKPHSTFYPWCENMDPPRLFFATGKPGKFFLGREVGSSTWFLQTISTHNYPRDLRFSNATFFTGCSKNINNWRFCKGYTLCKLRDATGTVYRISHFRW